MSATRDRELAQAAADQAMGAIARLIGADPEPPVGECRRLKLADLAPGLWSPLAPVTGIFAALRGSASGHAGLLLGTLARDEILVSLLGRRASAPAAVESALLELGNIAISAATTAIAGACGGVVIPSLPLLPPDLASGFDVEDGEPGPDAAVVHVVHRACRLRGRGIPIRFALQLEGPSR